MTSYSRTKVGTYGFKASGTSLIPENGSNQGDKHGTVANAYITLDLTSYSTTDTIEVIVNAEVSSEGADYG